jgi:hypothetical protein
MTSRTRRAPIPAPSSERARLRQDHGSAIIEFLVIGVLVLVPIAYIVMSVMRVQAAAFASTQAVREAGRAFVTADSPAQGQRQAQVAAGIAFEDQGFQIPSAALTIDCSGAPCLMPGSTVHVRIAWSVDLPWIPSDLAGGRSVSVPIEADHEVPVDVYRVTS